MNKLLLLLVILFVIATTAIFTWIATRPAAPKPYHEDYQRALRTYPGSAAGIDAGLKRFADAYTDLTQPDIGERIERLYADPMYFNDSLKTFESRQPLVDYMIATARILENSTVEIQQTLRDGNDVFVRWTMTFSSESMGREIKSESIGMTHLRFDAEGRVVLHQDFWDSAAGLYRYLPVVGYALKQVDKRMTD